MKSILFANFTEGDKKQAIEKLVKDSSPRTDFFLMVVLSILMATFGIIIDNAAVVIGSMLIAPILYPVLGCGMGIAMLDGKLFWRSLYTMLKSVLVGGFAAIFVTYFFFPHGAGLIENQEIMSRLEPNIVSLAIALVAGFAASFAMVKPELNETLPGVAISVSLVPPLAVSGIGFALFDWEILTQSFLLFLINIGGIIAISFVVFFFMKLHKKTHVANVAIKKEDKKIEKEKKIGKEK